MASITDPVVVADVTSIGGAAFDVFIRAPHDTVSKGNGEEFIQFPLGAKIKVESVIQSCGGGAANTSVGFSRLSMKARFCGVIGDDEWGQGIQHALTGEGVLIDAAVIVEREISSFSIILVDSKTGNRTVLYSPNVNAHLRDPVFARDLVQSSRFIFLNHLSDVSSAILDDCLALVQKPGGCSFAWNPGGTQIKNGFDHPEMKALLRETDLLFLNAEEAMTFTHCHGERRRTMTQSSASFVSAQDDTTREEAIHASLRTLTKAGAKIACVSDGAAGAYLSDGKHAFFAPIDPETKVVDTTGAGDAFAVGVTWSVFRGHDLQMSLRAGMINAASVVSVIGTQAGLLRETEIRMKLATSSHPVTSFSL